MPLRNLSQKFWNSYAYLCERAIRAMRPNANAVYAALHMKSFLRRSLMIVPVAILFIACSIEGDERKASSGRERFESEQKEVASKLRQEIEGLKLKLQSLELKASKLNAPEIKAASEVRIRRVREKLKTATDRVDDLAESSEQNWNEKRESAVRSIDQVSDKMESALERERFNEEGSEKLTKIEVKIDRLKTDAQNLSAEAK